MTSFQIWDSLELSNKTFFLCYNHEFYLDGVNIFENCEVIKHKEDWYGKKELTGWLVKPGIDLVSNKTKNITFEIYELKRNLQLIAFDTRKIKNESFLKAQFSNEENLIKNVEIPVLPFNLGVKQFVSKEKTTIITIEQVGDTYYSHRYLYFYKETKFFYYMLYN